jgi:hypothetical protein
MPSCRCGSWCSVSGKFIWDCGRPQGHWSQFLYSRLTSTLSCQSFQECSIPSGCRLWDVRQASPASRWGYTFEMRTKQCTNHPREAFWRSQSNKNHRAPTGSTPAVVLHKFWGLFNDASNIEIILILGSTIHTILLFRITRVSWNTKAQMDHYQNDALPILSWRYETDISTNSQAGFKKKWRRSVSFVICNDTIQIAGGAS